jgi:predicted HicB family RNase H-like nuclease
MEDQRNSRGLKSQYYKMITFKANPQLDERLMKAAETRKVSLSQIVRECCITALETLEATES